MMNISLRLSPEELADLEQKASASGIDVDDYVLGVVRRQLETADTESSGQTLGHDQWSREFRAWLASHPSRNPNFDDSRESIYD